MRAQQSPLRPAFGRDHLAYGYKVGAFPERETPHLFLYAFSRGFVKSPHVTVQEPDGLEHVTAFAGSILYALRVLDLILRRVLRSAYYTIVRALQDVVVREEATDERIVQVGPSFLECVAAV